ncbi:hypothetical protein HYH02_015320 [Chlamydomonas schloesseri]|uniref:Uncharacterized protein n=1 Tax=Chlamydomonas schloesseri TaxID=2026947 RepID=A0A835VRT0_9CHLO|nr:hypothetical protein HYH02_015320 [Chlamydomonas schloesseri]|eukprot:KAG2423478.1 hypothetical protein HYH02_015320 [Chlamydomonas schloesseri]
MMPAEDGQGARPRGHGASARGAPARGELPPYSYEPLKHRWELKLNFMSGVTLGPWLSFLWTHWRDIDWGLFWHRVAFLTCMSVVNTLLSAFDWLLHSRAVAAQPLHPEPLFILGHPRSGTTHLHNLLSRDPAFAFANTFHAGFPSSFLALEPARGLLAGLLAPTRPMDRMALSWELPAEDEIAVNVLSGCRVSPYAALVLPRAWRAAGVAAGGAPGGGEAVEGGSRGAAGGGGGGAGAAGSSGRAGGGVVGLRDFLDWEWEWEEEVESEEGAAAEHQAQGEEEKQQQEQATRREAQRQRQRPLPAQQRSGGAAAAAGQDAGGGAGTGTGMGAEGHPVAAAAAAAAAAPSRQSPHQRRRAALRAAAFEEWLASFMWFMKKITYRHVRLQQQRTAAATAAAAAATAPGCSGAQPPPPAAAAQPPQPPMLLIKSPVHTARLGTWLRLFPRARFVYVHRHPLEVFQSAAHMANTYYPYTYLQAPDDATTNDFIMDQYELMYSSYASRRAAVPPGRLVELGFGELEADPLAALGRVYEAFGWSDRWPAVAPLFGDYSASLADFKKNQFTRLTPEAEAVVRRRWAPSFAEFGYQ